MHKGNFPKVFGLKSHHRKEDKVWHEVVNVFFIVIAAAICGYNSICHIHT